jgi:hypothetical protein
MENSHIQMLSAPLAKVFADVFAALDFRVMREI